MDKMEYRVIIFEGSYAVHMVNFENDTPVGINGQPVFVFGDSKEELKAEIDMVHTAFYKKHLRYPEDFSKMIEAEKETSLDEDTLSVRDDVIEEVEVPRI